MENAVKVTPENCRDMMKPGTYRLTRDVVNPCADKRHKHDWRKEPVLKAGAEFLVEDERSLFPEDATSRERAWTSLRLVGARWSHMKLYEGADNDVYNAIAQALEMIPETLGAQLTRLDVKRGFATWLVESGSVDRELFERLWNAYMDGGVLPLREPQ
jgi:hypothetical protein